MAKKQPETNKELDGFVEVGGALSVYMDMLEKGELFDFNMAMAEIAQIALNNLQPDESNERLVVVLNDGESYADLDGTEILSLPKRAKLEDSLSEPLVTVTRNDD